MTEWLKLMLEEIARKQAERERGFAEQARRASESATARTAESVEQSRVPKRPRANEP